MLAVTLQARTSAQPEKASFPLFYFRIGSLSADLLGNTGAQAYPSPTEPRTRLSTVFAQASMSFVYPLKFENH